jgi:Skp family chaperone for outer membrane proteins
MDFQTAFNLALGAFGVLCLFVLNHAFAQIAAAKAAAERAATDADKRVADARRELEAQLENERKDRERDRHALRGEVNAVGGKLQLFMLEVAKECINSERLSAALEPMTETLSEIKSDIRDVFKKLENKVDK